MWITLNSASCSPAVALQLMRCRICHPSQHGINNLLLGSTRTTSLAATENPTLYNLYTSCQVRDVFYQMAAMQHLPGTVMNRTREDAKATKSWTGIRAGYQNVCSFITPMRWRCKMCRFSNSILDVHIHLGTTKRRTGHITSEISKHHQHSLSTATILSICIFLVLRQR